MTVCKEHELKNLPENKPENYEDQHTMLTCILKSCMCKKTRVALTVLLNP